MCFQIFQWNNKWLQWIKPVGIENALHFTYFARVTVDNKIWEINKILQNNNAWKRQNWRSSDWHVSSKVKCWICEMLPVKLVQIKSIESSYTRGRPSFKYAPEINKSMYFCLLLRMNKKNFHSISAFQWHYW